MQGITHMLGGAVAVTAYIVGTKMNVLPEFIAATACVGAIGGLISDIDHPNSKISHKLKPVSAIVTRIFSHRGLFHTPDFLCRTLGLVCDGRQPVGRNFDVGKLSLYGHCISFGPGCFE